MVDTSLTPALGVMELVAQRDAATLLPMIVWSDMWAVYNNVQHIPAVAQHQTVNHSIEFVNSASVSESLESLVRLIAVPHIE